MLLLALPAGAAAAEPVRYSDTARVIAVEPIVERTYPPERRNDCLPAAPPLLPPAASPGVDIRRQQALVDGAADPSCRRVERREPVERVLGYRVTYDYAGRRYTRRLAQPPGERLPVRVALDPLY